jgi:flagellar hook-length control protein FliK
MTISTYTEPQPVNSVVDDSPQSQETEENAEVGAFAKLLAGLLQKIEICETDIEAADFSVGEEGIQLFAMKDSVPVAVFENAAEESVNTGKDSEKLFVEKELSEIEIVEEQASFLMSAEHLFARSNDQIGDEETGADFLQELPEIETPDLLLAGENTDFSASKDDAHITGAAENASPADGMELTAETAAAQENEKSLQIEIDAKKGRALSKDVNLEPRPESSRVEETASLRKESEKSGQSRLDEARSRRRDRVAIDIRDQRTAGSSVSNNTEIRINAGVETVSGRHAQGDAPVREMTLELRVPEGQSPQAQTTWEVRSGNALENMLARELHQNFNGDIVRHASMALRDGGEATIRLALKPDTLGNVKIHLELTENKVTGRIVVESEEALNAFKKEIASLEQAFRDSGFTNADLNLSLAADASNAGWQEQEADAYTPRNVASRYDSSLEGAGQETLLVDVFFGYRPGSINMFA